MTIRKGSSYKDRPPHEITEDTKQFERELDAEIDSMQEMYSSIASLARSQPDKPVIVVAMERIADLEAERDMYAELWEMQCNETAQQSADYVDEQKRSMALEQLVRDCHEFMGRADRLQFPEIERRMAELGVVDDGSAVAR